VKANHSGDVNLDVKVLVKEHVYHALVVVLVLVAEDVLELA